MLPKGQRFAIVAYIDKFFVVHTTLLADEVC